jgi:hypothetical protein
VRLLKIASRVFSLSAVRAEFPLRYAPPEEILSPSSLGEKVSPRGSPSAASTTPPPFPPSKTRNLGSVPEEDIFAILEKEKPKQGGFSEPIWGRKEGVVKATSGKSKSRHRKRGGDIIWASSKSQLGQELQREKGRTAALQEKLLTPSGADVGGAKSINVGGDQAAGETGQQVAPQKASPLGFAKKGKEKGLLSKSPPERAYDWKQHVEAALQNDDTWRLQSDEKERPAFVKKLVPQVTATSTKAQPELLEPIVGDPSPRKPAVTRPFPKASGSQPGQREKKAKLGLFNESTGESEEDSGRLKPAIPFLYEQAMAAANEPLESPVAESKPPL